MEVASANYLAHSYLQYEVLPALSIFASVINSKLAFNLTGNPDCGTVPAHSAVGTPTCPASECNVNTWNSGGGMYGCYFCRAKVGAPFQTDVNNVKTQRTITNNTIHSLIKQANVMLQEPIINITQLTIFGNQFLALTNTMESGISKKQCQYDAPSYLCFNNEGNFYWCKCVDSGVPCDCRECPDYSGNGPLNEMTYLKGLDHA